MQGRVSVRVTAIDVGPLGNRCGRCGNQIFIGGSVQCSGLAPLIVTCIDTNKGVGGELD